MTRDCEITITEKGEKKTIKGKFHEWGVDFCEFESGAGNFSAAIIEFDDGTIKLFSAETIKFLN